MFDREAAGAAEKILLDAAVIGKNPAEIGIGC
jgi:hypothetical protein